MHVCMNEHNSTANTGVCRLPVEATAIDDKEVFFMVLYEAEVCVTKRSNRVCTVRNGKLINT